MTIKLSDLSDAAVEVLLGSHGDDVSLFRTANTVRRQLLRFGVIEPVVNGSRHPLTEEGRALCDELRRRQETCDVAAMRAVEQRWLLDWGKPDVTTLEALTEARSADVAERAAKRLIGRGTMTEATANRLAARPNPDLMRLAAPFADPMVYADVPARTLTLADIHLLARELEGNPRGTWALAERLAGRDDEVGRSFAALLDVDKALFDRLLSDPSDTVREAAALSHLDMLDGAQTDEAIRTGSWHVRYAIANRANGLTDARILTLMRDPESLVAYAMEERVRKYRDAVKECAELRRMFA